MWLRLSFGYLWAILALSFGEKRPSNHFVSRDGSAPSGWTSEGDSHRDECFHDFFCRWDCRAADKKSAGKIRRCRWRKNPESSTRDQEGLSFDDEWNETPQARRADRRPSARKLKAQAPG